MVTMIPRETWTAQRCASHWDVSESRWRGMLVTTRRCGTCMTARMTDEGFAWECRAGHAPPPLGYDPVTGRMIWDANAVRRGKGLRPGRGYRSDLYGIDNRAQSL